MNPYESMKAVSRIVEESLSAGLIPDMELYHFISSAYGLADRNEIIEFITDGHDSGAVLDLISYPSDNLRNSVERFIPDEGISCDVYEKWFDIPALAMPYFILIDEKKILLSENDSLYCRRKIIKRLNLHINLNYLSELKDVFTGTDFYGIRLLLRKKKFITGDAGRRFIKDLITGYNSMESNNSEELFSLIGLTCNMLNNQDEDPRDILSIKREYYKNAYMEALEFAKLLKTYSMEFIMMQKIQPPLITAEEALSMLEMISRIFSIAGGMSEFGFNQVF